MSLSSASSTQSKNNNKNIKLLGVAGGIGSGKSTACKLLLEELGCLAHIDADKVAHSVYEPGNAARVELIETFGESIVNPVDQTINRPVLGSIVFADPAKMSQLEQIVWPHTKRMVQEQLQQLKLDPSKLPVVIVEAAMLLDANWNEWMDAVWMVRASETVALERIVQRGGSTLEQAQQRITAQEKRRGISNLQQEVANRVVTAVITNDGTLQELRDQLQAKLVDPNAWY